MNLNTCTDDVCCWWQSVLADNDYDSLYRCFMTMTIISLTIYNDDCMMMVTKVHDGDAIIDEANRTWKTDILRTWALSDFGPFYKIYSWMQNKVQIFLLFLFQLDSNDHVPTLDVDTVSNDLIIQHSRPCIRCTQLLLKKLKETLPKIVTRSANQIKKLK